MKAHYQTSLRPFLEAVWAEAYAMHRTIRQIDSVKFILVDLDDTLWRAVVVGVGDIAPNTVEGWPLGFVESPCYAKSRGILLGIVGKNEEQIIAGPWNKLMRGRLSMDDVRDDFPELSNPRCTSCDARRLIDDLRDFPNV